MARKLSPGLVVASQSDPSPTNVPVDSTLLRFCCQMRKKVLPGSHSHRSTRFDRNDSTLKSGLEKVKADAASVTANVPSGRAVIDVPATSPYVRRSLTRGRVSSP